MSEQLEQVVDTGDPVQPVTPAKQAAPDPTTQDDEGRDYEAEIKKLREEAAKWRTQFRAVEKEKAELEPLAKKLAEIEEAQKTEEQKLREKLEAFEAEAKRAQAEAGQARKEAAFARLAAKAGVDPELAALIDLSKLDLDNEEATLEQLSKLTKPVPPKAGGPSNPAQAVARKQTDEELRRELFGAGRTTNQSIWGG